MRTTVWQECLSLFFCYQEFSRLRIGKFHKLSWYRMEQRFHEECETIKIIVTLSRSIKKCLPG